MTNAHDSLCANTTIGPLRVSIIIKSLPQRCDYDLIMVDADGVFCIYLNLKPIYLHTYTDTSHSTNSTMYRPAIPVMICTRRADYEDEWSRRSQM
ncbi:hypothetical protein BLOT_001174 [Blomia tropicalis]|nr:hypothetical protein BLOT_001174 [Blomia tropicalis]